MKALLSLTALALGALLLSAGITGPREVTWLEDLGSAELLARKTGKPLLAVFR